MFVCNWKQMPTEPNVCIQFQMRVPGGSWIRKRHTQVNSLRTGHQQNATKVFSTRLGVWDLLKQPDCNTNSSPEQKTRSKIQSVPASHALSFHLFNLFFHSKTGAAFAWSQLRISNTDEPEPRASITNRSFCLHTTVWISLCILRPFNRVLCWWKRSTIFPCGDWQNPYATKWNNASANRSILVWTDPRRVTFLCSSSRMMSDMNHSWEKEICFESPQRACHHGSSEVTALNEWAHPRDGFSCSCFAIPGESRKTACMQTTHLRDHTSQRILSCIAWWTRNIPHKVEIYGVGKNGWENPRCRVSCRVWPERRFQLDPKHVSENLTGSISTKCVFKP